MVLEGVFTRDEDGTARFDDTGAPTQEALQRIVRRVRDRSVRWLHKNGLMDARPIQEHSNEPPEGGAIDVCANVALGGGTLVRLDAEGANRTEDGDHRAHSRRRSTGSICKPQCASKPRMMSYPVHRIQMHEQRAQPVQRPPLHSRGRADATESPPASVRTAAASIRAEASRA
jgi:hypothetical protein